VREVWADLPALELKARAARIASGLRAHLPTAYPEALAIVERAPGEPGPTEGRFVLMPLLDFVGLYGRDERERSLAALERLTRHFSAEFAIRGFLLDDLDGTLARMAAWSKHADWRVRRLASEGSRPLLPWGTRVPALVADPRRTQAILDRLHDDPSETVRRSVANHLNDVAKRHPEHAVAVARRWLDRPRHPDRARATVRHALRTLVKRGHPGALDLLGFGGKADLVAFDLGTPRVTMGGHLEFAAELRARGKARVRLSIDYAVCHRRADGRLAPKVFKLAVREAAPGETVRVAKRHAIRPITTRRYYAGEQAVELRVNGAVVARADFVLRM
jgi:3-methyladenine DNA glycosylase AlkC